MFLYLENTLASFQTYARTVSLARMLRFRVCRVATVVMLYTTSTKL